MFTIKIGSRYCILSNANVVIFLDDRILVKREQVTDVTITASVAEIKLIRTRWELFLTNVPLVSMMSEIKVED